MWGSFHLKFKLNRPNIDCFLYFSAKFTESFSVSATSFQPKLKFIKNPMVESFNSNFSLVFSL